mmetsp:Transcript_5052/g.16940  ORF Transcript_5052/g.16940 Transcript_5052/m.16940 type:complete len:247 (-) Transcript_5052:60-800(-)
MGIRQLALPLWRADGRGVVHELARGPLAERGLGLEHDEVVRLHGIRREPNGLQRRARVPRAHRCLPGGPGAPHVKHPEEYAIRRHARPEVVDHDQGAGAHEARGLEGAAHAHAAVDEHELRPGEALVVRSGIRAPLLRAWLRAREAKVVVRLRAQLDEDWMEVGAVIDIIGHHVEPHAAVVHGVHLRAGHELQHAPGAPARTPLHKQRLRRGREEGRDHAVEGRALRLVHCPLHTDRAGQADQRDR